MELVVCVFAAMGLMASTYGKYLYWRSGHNGLLAMDSAIAGRACSRLVDRRNDYMTESYGGARRLRLVAPRDQSQDRVSSQIW